MRYFSGIYCINHTSVIVNLIMRMGHFFDARFPAFFPAPIDPIDRLGSTAPAFPSIARPAHPSAAQPRFRLLPRRLVDPVRELIGTNRLLKDRKRDFVLF